MRSRQCSTVSSSFLPPRLTYLIRIPVGSSSLRWMLLTVESSRSCPCEIQQTRSSIPVLFFSRREPGTAIVLPLQEWRHWWGGSSYFPSPCGPTIRTCPTSGMQSDPTPGKCGGARFLGHFDFSLTYRLPKC